MLSVRFPESGLPPGRARSPVSRRETPPQTPIYRSLDKTIIIAHQPTVIRKEVLSMAEQQNILTMPALALRARAGGLANRRGETSA